MSFCMQIVCLYLCILGGVLTEIMWGRIRLTKLLFSSICSNYTTLPCPKITLNYFYPRPFVFYSFPCAIFHLCLSLLAIALSQLLTTITHHSRPSVKCSSLESYHSTPFLGSQTMQFKALLQNISQPCLELSFIVSLIPLIHSDPVNGRDFVFFAF